MSIVLPRGSWLGRTGPSWARALVAGVFVGAAACSDSGSPIPKTLSIAGRLERGSTIVVRPAERPERNLTLSAMPESAVQVLSDSSMVLTSAGPVTITLTSQDGRVNSQGVTVAVPPTIVFDLTVAGNRDIYSATIDGDDLTRLTTSGGDDVHPSAVNGTVVFTSFRNGNAELYRVPLTGGVDQRITTTAAGETEPSLSPDGQRIAYVKASSGGVGGVWIAGVDGSNPTQLTRSDASASGSPQVSPTWGPDGQVLFVGTAGASADLYTSSADSAPTSSTPVALVNTTHAEVDPAWSVDGAQIAFVSDRSSATQLYVAKLAGGADAVRLITQAGTNTGQPTWLSDGRIVYATYRNNAWSLHWIDPVALDGVHDIPLPAGNPQHPSAAR